MIEVAACVICDGEIRRLKCALVAPFLATRIWERSPFCVDLVECLTCGFRFYNPRLDAAEETRLYAGYRSPEYQRMRQAYEPWYTVAFNAELASARSYEIRREKIRAILRQHLAGRAIKSVLDYGGDHGDLARGLIEGAAAFVYDISGIPAAEGVTATSDPAGCQADLVINSNVLEHVGFPRQLVEEILRATPAGGIVYLEVPCESPSGLMRIARRVAQVAIMSVARPALARLVVRPAALYMMHEHINYFTERSLTTLMRVCGCAVMAAGSYRFAGRAGKGELAWCLGTVAASGGVLERGDNPM
jgi:SAM-dependent methyltransferase